MCCALCRLLPPVHPSLTPPYCHCCLFASLCFYLVFSHFITHFLLHPSSTVSQGNAAKLVHTPLTDKCYLTLTQAMKMGLGGNPYGPAGTGKTESVKALGGLFGRQVLVFNCDEVKLCLSLGKIMLCILDHWICPHTQNKTSQASLCFASFCFAGYWCEVNGTNLCGLGEVWSMGLLWWV